jgi:hypothetical protein
MLLPCPDKSSELHSPSPILRMPGVRPVASRLRDRTAEHRRESALPPAPPLRQSVLRPSARRSPDAQKIVALWNARQAGGRELWFYPTIGAAIAGLPWLSFSCPACHQVGSVDLRTLDRHPGPLRSQASFRPSHAGDVCRMRRLRSWSSCRPARR